MFNYMQMLGLYFTHLNNSYEQSWAYKRLLTTVKFGLGIFNETSQENFP